MQFRKIPSFWKKRKVVSYSLLPFSLVYFLIYKLRNLLLKPQKVAIPIICVGNFTVGGSGKTLLASLIGRKLQEKNIDFCFVMRGYLGKIKQPTRVDPTVHTSEDVGDEALLLAKIGKTYIGQNRFLAAKLAEKEGNKLIILDDGLQNQRLLIDYKIEVLDENFMYGNNLLLPAGPLREIPYTVDYRVVIKNSDIVPSTELDKSKKYIAFSAIGNNEKFFTSLEKTGITLLDKISYQDHHPYSSEDVKYLTSLAQTHNAKLITTAKDAVKLSKYGLGLVVFEVKLQLEDIEQIITALNKLT